MHPSPRFASCTLITDGVDGVSREIGPVGQFDENRACALNILTPLLANHKEHRSRTKYGLIEKQEEVIFLKPDQRFSIFALRENYVFCYITSCNKPGIEREVYRVLRADLTLRKCPNAASESTCNSSGRPSRRGSHRWRCRASTHHLAYFTSGVLSLSSQKMVEPDVWRCCSRRRGSRAYLGDGRSGGRDAERAYWPPVGRSHNFSPQVLSLGKLRLTRHNAAALGVRIQVTRQLFGNFAPTS